MIVVLAIIGLIAAVAVPQVMKMLSGSKSKAAKVQLETVLNGLNYYNIDVGTYPAQEQGLDVLWEADAIDGWNGPYIRRPEQLVDPWGRKLIYKVPGERGAFDLITYGADGKEGGEGDDADLFATK
jgi:general secretion pathway protein G